MGSKRQHKKRYYDKNGLIRFGGAGGPPAPSAYPPYKKVDVDNRHNLTSTVTDSGFLWRCSSCDYEVLVPFTEKYKRFLQEKKEAGF